MMVAMQPQNHVFVAIQANLIQNLINFKFSGIQFTNVFIFLLKYTLNLVHSVAKNIKLKIFRTK